MSDMLAMQRPFSRLSFSGQFVLLCLIVLLAGMLFIGSWLTRQIETSVVERAASITALYVESILAVLLKEHPIGKDPIDAEMRRALDDLFMDSPLRRKVVRFKLWRNDGEILYSTDESLLGKRFPVEGALAAAFSGTVQAKVSNLDKPENVHERTLWDQLIEIYVPVHTGQSQEVIAVAEFYKSVDNLAEDIRTAQQRGWAIVAVANSVLFLLLIGLVRRASNTIEGQQQDLQRQMDQLRVTLRENEEMHEQLGEAGRQTTALNEQFLHRVAADLHDGPAQNLALAMLRLDSVADACGGCLDEKDVKRNDFATVRTALQSAMTELRTISAGLGLPGIESLTLSATAHRAIEDYQCKTGRKVDAEIDNGLCEAALAVKITLYRLIQESLNNGLMHAAGASQRVRVCNVNGQAQVEVIDSGPGFDVSAPTSSGRLGLAYMRERVKLVSGQFEVKSTPGHGTQIVARLPLSLGEGAYV